MIDKKHGGGSKRHQQLEWKKHLLKARKIVGVNKTKGAFK